MAHFHSLLRFSFFRLQQQTEKSVFFRIEVKTQLMCVWLKYLHVPLLCSVSLLHIQFTPLSLLSTTIQRWDSPPTMSVTFLFAD